MKRSYVIGMLICLMLCIVCTGCKKGATTAEDVDAAATKVINVGV